ncbi:MAG: hypothetical protein AB7E37_03225 [Candidatus Altimarinota bacterium]
MKYIDIQNHLEKLKVFSSNDLKILDDKYNKSKTSKWKESLYIKQIIKGYYILNKIKLNNSLLFKISNIIYNPSYISLESAFSYYGIIPEQVFSVTSVSTRKTNTFHTDIGTFEYKKIKNELFFGYEILDIHDNKILIARLEKALIDYFYLYDNVKSIIDLEYLRFNKDILKEKLNINILKKYSSLLNSKVVNKRVNLLVKYINND